MWNYESLFTESLLAFLREEENMDYLRNAFRETILELQIRRTLLDYGLSRYIRSMLVIASYENYLDENKLKSVQLT